MKSNALNSYTQEYSIYDNEDLEKIALVSHATSSPERLRILKSLLEASKNIATLSQDLKIPISSVMRHIDILAKAKLVKIIYQPGPKGHTKFCCATTHKYIVNFFQDKQKQTKKQHSVEMPIGLYTDCNITSPCGLLSANDAIGMDLPNIFYSPRRSEAELLWFTMGHVTYSFPTYPLLYHRCNEIKFSFEICSEFAGWNNHWPSDITVWINGKEVVTFTSPGDFGGEQGRYTPAFWSISNTQFGLLTKISVNANGVYLNKTLMHNNITFDDLGLYNNKTIELKIGIKDDARNKGGINLFGKNFGNHPQAIVMTVS